MSLFKKIKPRILCLLTMTICLGPYFSYSQTLKVELVSGEVTVYKKGKTITTNVFKNEMLAPTDRIYLGDNAILVLSDADKKLLEINKKGYLTGKQLSEKLSKATPQGYHRYLAYIIKEIKNYEDALKFTGNPSNNLQPLGNTFIVTFPDTIYMFSYDQLKINWEFSKYTDVANVLIVNDKNNLILDLDLSGPYFSFNNITSYFIVNKGMYLSIFERRRDGSKLLMSKTLVLPAALDETKTKNELDLEFKDLEDIRLKRICQAVKWEINHYSLKALDIYKILMLDFPNDPIVKSSFAAFSKRTGLE